MNRHIGRCWRIACATVALAAPAAFAQTTNMGQPHGSSGATDPLTGSTGGEQEREQKAAGAGSRDPQKQTDDGGKDRAGSPAAQDTPSRTGTTSQGLPQDATPSQSLRHGTGPTSTPTLQRQGDVRPPGRRQADRSRGGTRARETLPEDRGATVDEQENSASKSGPGPVAPRSPGQVGGEGQP